MNFKLDMGIMEEMFFILDLIVNIKTKWVD